MPIVAVFLVIEDAMRFPVGTALALVTVLSACSDRSAGPAAENVGFQLSKSGGDGQSGPANGLLALPLQAVVMNAAGDPVRGARVIFRAPGAGGVTLSDTIATSGIDGVALVFARLGSQQSASATIAQGFLSGQEMSVVTWSATTTAPPTLDAISKTSVQAGDTIVVTGTSFNADLAGNSVFFGAARGRILSAPAANQLQVVVPACLTAGSIDVLVAVGSVSTNTRAVTYNGGAPALALPALGTITVSGTELGSCLRLGGDGASYLIVPQFATASVPLDTAPYVIGNVGGAVVSSSRVAAAHAHAEESFPAAFDAALRAAEHRLVPLALAQRDEHRPRFTVAAQQPDLGSKRTFQVLSSLTTSTFKSVTAALRFNGTNVYIYVDVTTAAAFSEAQLAQIGRLFDQDLYGIDVRTFGSESDVDGNGHVIVVLSPVINGLTPAAQCQSQGFVAGFFFGNDLINSLHSNRAEIFYAVVPDPSGTYSCAHTASAVTALTPVTFIHEFQHMISYNQHVLVRGGDDEAVWLNEGLSHIAEEMGSRMYEQRYPPPLGRSDATQVLPDSSVPFMNGDLGNSYRYLLSTDTVSMTLFKTGGSLSERGAAWLFLRWLGDQKDSTIFRKLVQTARTGTENIERQSGESFAALFGDWSVALYTDSIVGVPKTSIPSRYKYSSRNLRRIYARLVQDNAGSPRFPRPFPIVLKTLAYNGTVQDKMTPGTMSFFRLQTPRPSAGLALQFAKPGGAVFDPNRKAQVGIFRLQ